MTSDRSQFEQVRDGDYWSKLAEIIDRRDRGEVVDAAEFANGDPALAKRIQECLAGFGWLENALSGSGSEISLDVNAPMPESIGDYAITRELGRGGMGVVYEAVHQGLGRRVALKVLFDPALRGSTARERFLREARTAASLHHTNIVPVFDIGTADGHLYFAMQLIEGCNLEEWTAKDTSGLSADSHGDSRHAGRRDRPTCREPLDPMQVARLGVQAAEALAYAHAHGVIHRDIKPSNLLLDSSGTLWIADFGLSRRPTDATVTASGTRVGTPRYMSPEQATAQWEASDARTDIYSLGVTLYELLTGQPVFSPCTPPQLLLQIIRSDPRPPRRINPRVPRDLETIVMKAMAKRPADRYGSASELAEDLRRVLADEPVRARRIGPAGRLLRWCKREPLLASVCTVSLFALTTVAGAYQVRLTQQRDTAVEAAGDARLRLADALFERARAVRATLETGRRWLAIDLVKQSMAIRPRSELSVEAIRALQLYDARSLGDLQQIGGPVTAVAIEQRTGLIAAAVGNREGHAVAIWDPKSASVVQRLAAAESVNFVAFSPDGRRLAGTTEKRIHLWDLENGSLRVLTGGPSGLSTVSFSTDGRTIFGFAGGLCAGDVNSGQRQATLVAGPVEIGHVVTSSDSKILAASVATNELVPAEIQRWSLPELKPLDALRIQAVRPDPLADAMGVICMAASPVGKCLAASCGDSRIRLWDAETGKPQAVLEGHRIPAVSLAFSATGDTLVSCDGFELKLWDARTGEELATLMRSNSADIGQVAAVATGHDGVIATAGDSCRLWEVAAPSFRRVLDRLPERVRSLAASPDGRWLAWPQQDSIRVWDRSDEEVHRDISLPLQGEASLAFTPDSRFIVVVGTGTNRLQMVEAVSGRIAADFAAEPGSSIAFSPDAGDVVIAHTDGIIRRWKRVSGQVTASYTGQVGPVTCVALSRDGRFVAASNHDMSESHERTVHLWDAPSGRLLRTWPAHRTAAFGVAFSPGGDRLASCGTDRTVRVWEASSGELQATLTGHATPPTAVVFSADGSLLASCSLDGHVLVWDAGTGTLLADLASRACGSLSAVTFSADGRWIFAGGGPYRWTHSAPGAVEAWDLSEIRRDLEELGIAWEPAAATQ